MEKFYILEKGLELEKEYLKYAENRKAVNNEFKLFKERNGISATAYSPCSDTLYIVPSKEDIEKFGKHLCKEVQGELRSFKKNTAICKDWVDSLRAKELRVIRHPMVGIYFMAHGRSKYRIFDHNELVYCSFESENDFETPKGFTEIKASEFYKIVEEIEQKEG